MISKQIGQFAVTFVLCCTTLAMAVEHIQLVDAVGANVKIVEPISVQGNSRGTFFQKGQPTPLNKIDYDHHDPLCFISIVSQRTTQNSSETVTIPIGTGFTLVKAGPDTVSINLFGNRSFAITGYEFSTTDPLVASIDAQPEPNWMIAVSRISADPALLDRSILRQCFGDYIQFSFAR